MTRQCLSRLNTQIVIILLIVALAGTTSLSRTSLANASRVTRVKLVPNQPRYNGGCPVTITFVGTIETDGPGVVTYTFLRSDRATGPTHTLQFDSAGEKEVSTTWTLGDATALPEYSGWQAIKILSPNEIESDHETGTFQLNCRTSSPVRPAPTSPPPEPSLDPVNGRFRVTLQGFTVDHQTRDDALERDGVGDEVFLVHPAAFLVDSSGNQLRRSLGSFGPVFGQLNSSRPGSIQAGGATATGGLVSGDSYPGAGGAPWIGGGLTPTVGDAFPHVFYEGVIYSGLTVLVVFPSLWEWDAGADSLLAVYQDTFASPQLSQNLVGYLRNTPYTSDLSNYIRPASEIGVPARVSIGDGPLGLGEVNSRPIGMVWSRGRYLFDSRAVVLTYEMADRFAQNDLFGKGNGVVEVRYADDQRLEGRYTLYLKVERLP